MMRPVKERLCTLKELKDGTYDLVDVALMNDILDVTDENNYRASKQDM